MAITIYWSPLHIDQSEPTSLVKDLSKNRSSGTKSFFSCPAVTPNLRNTFVFKMPTDYDQSKLNKVREASLDSAPTVMYKNSFLFFASKPVVASFTAPYFHPPKHFKWGAVVPGSFNIGTWFRPYNCEFQLWKPNIYFYLEKDEPIFYMNLLTEDPVTFIKFRTTEKLAEYAKYCSDSTEMGAHNKGLDYRYSTFTSEGFDNLVLTEIKRNLVNHG